MALVLRKAVLSKNAYLLKCLRGRPLATAPNKKNVAPFSKAATLRPMTQQLQKVLPDIQMIAVKTLMQQKQDTGKNHYTLHKSLSCPCFSQANDIETVTLPRTRSNPIIKENYFSKCNLRFLHGVCGTRERRAYSSLMTPLTPAEILSVSDRLKEACGVSVCPPAGCCALPPPCNQPAKCLQHITGYYYYPYGTWFCGPYHIKTGPCGPCAGPVQPGGPCGPAPPNPGGPCGPAGVVLCGPGANCASCSCPCGPGACPPCCCGFSPPCSCGPCGPCGPCYDPYSPCGLPGACAPCGSCGCYGICNGPCGPCYNVPCVPIQVCGPITPGGPCGPRLASNLLDFCARGCLCLLDAQYNELSIDSETCVTCHEALDEIEAPLESLGTKVSNELPPMASSRINPSLKECANYVKPMSKPHVFANASGNGVHVRYFTTVVRTRSKQRNDVQTRNGKSIQQDRADLSTFNKCCNRPWSNCSLLCNGNPTCHLCPQLCKPRYIPTKEERDRPYIPPNCFSYSNTPRYRNPSPYTAVLDEVYCKQPWS